MKNILGDPKVCTVRLVLNLEKMVVKEAQRAFTYLCLYDYLTDLVVVNRVLPEEVTDEYFAAWHRSQKKYDALVDTAFSPVPIRRTPLFDHEIVGLDSLAEMAEAIFGDTDPTQRFHTTVSQHLKKVGTATSCTSSCRSSTRTRSTSPTGPASCSSASGRTSARSACPASSTAPG